MLVLAKKILVGCFILTISIIRAQNTPNSFITLNIKKTSPFYFLQGNEGIPNGTISQPFLQNSGFSAEIGFKLYEKEQLFFGLQHIGRNYKINYPVTQYGPISKNHSNALNSFYVTYNYTALNKNKYKIFLFSRLHHTSFWDDVEYKVNDSIPPNHYTIKNRRNTTQVRQISASFGVGVEYQLFINEIFLMFQSEYVFNLLTPRSKSLNSTNRIVFNLGLSFKIY